MRNGLVEGNIGTHPGSLVDSGTPRKRMIDPAVKELLRDVLVPAMVQQYLASPDMRENGGSDRERIH